jgi:hypothetical protein
VEADYLQLVGKLLPQVSKSLGASPLP